MWRLKWYGGCAAAAILGIISAWAARDVLDGINVILGIFAVIIVCSEFMALVRDWVEG